MKHSDKITFEEYFQSVQTAFRGVISACVALRWMIEHDFELPDDDALKQMEAEVDLEMSDAWAEIYVTALREWLGGQ